MSISPRIRRGCAMGGAVVLAVVAAGAAVYLFVALRLPEDAPLARMYRTEAELTVLANAVANYRATHGEYPPAGVEGLEMAVAHLTRHVNYLPGGPPTDAWDRPYVYIPSRQYAYFADALRDDQGVYCAPDTFQVYSCGADGSSGVEQPEARRDNITGWQHERPWRAYYKELTRQYLRPRVDR